MHKCDIASKDYGAVDFFDREIVEACDLLWGMVQRNAILVLAEFLCVDRRDEVLRRKSGDDILCRKPIGFELLLIDIDLNPGAPFHRKEAGLLHLQPLQAGQDEVLPLHQKAGIQAQTHRVFDEFMKKSDFFGTRRAKTNDAKEDTIEMTPQSRWGRYSCVSTG